MRIAVTGAHGQVSRALQALDGADVVAVGRPVLDFATPEGVAPALRAASADVIVNAAAYTAVERAEAEPDLAFAANEAGARAVAEAAAALDVPLIQLSTDYVFDGRKAAPYVETDAPNALNVYGASKLAGERAVMTAHPRAAIVRVSWVYSATGNNFVRTMLTLARDRDEIEVVSDQIGLPMAAPDIAANLVRIAENLTTTQRADQYGLFHLSGEGEASWADVAEQVFARSRALGGPTAQVRRIPSSARASAAQRPANSRLDGAKLRAVHGAALPDWRASLDACVTAILRG